MRDHLLDMLHSFAKYDFLEYNSRIYQRYSIHGLLNLYDFAGDQQIRTAAQIVLDYTTTKFAVSSNGLRRAGPYRRTTDNTDAENQAYFVDGSDPQTAFFMLWTGYPTGSRARRSSPDCPPTYPRVPPSTGP